MGYLLKEVLKAICGINQWSYAVFWKIGCQNPKLLIWEECYHNSTTGNHGINLQKVEGYQNAAQELVGDQVRLLVDKLMVSNHVYMVGQGLVGRAAFMGDHQWIVSGSYNEKAHPIEVVNEIRQQLSAGMQTLVVIPVIPHGVVLLGSPLVVMENVGFVHDIRSLILQVGCVPNVFVSDNYVRNNTASMFRLPIADVTSTPVKLHGNPTMVNSSPVVTSSCNLLTQFQDNLQVGVSNFSTPNLAQDLCRSRGDPCEAKSSLTRIVDSRVPPNKLTRGAVMPSKLISLPNHPSRSTNPGSSPNIAQPFSICRGSCLLKPQSAPHEGLSEGSHGTSTSLFETNKGHYATLQGHGTNISRNTDFSVSDFVPNGLCNGSQIPSSTELISEDIFFKSTARDDLFDVVGVDFSADRENYSSRSLNLQNLGPRVHSDYEGISESGDFSSLGSDHLLDAVISGINSTSRRISDDNMSCRTTISKISSSSVPGTPHSDLSKPMVRLCEPIGSSIRSGCGKNDSGSFSLNGSTYASQISSWVEQCPSASVSTANSKKVEETGKSNRKRLKPGENPKPRPKDRQMIQDRVKELREIVPNGAKCSIDALLERTIKHMLFLQSVTKHAEKLKPTIESKIGNEEGGMLLNDEFEGGATWALELGSQSMVCPIVVEDVNPPRQLLIEMLCEEQGIFLEIADIIRALGLTILKGVIKSRNDKIWARFAVEANRDVTRMEVFISLVRLLEQTLKASTSADNENIGLHPFPMASEQQQQQLVG